MFKEPIILLAYCYYFDGCNILYYSNVTIYLKKYIKKMYFIKCYCKVGENKCVYCYWVNMLHIYRIGYKRISNYPITLPNTLYSSKLNTLYYLHFQNVRFYQLYLFEIILFSFLTILPFLTITKFCRECSPNLSNILFLFHYFLFSCSFEA